MHDINIKMHYSRARLHLYYWGPVHCILVEIHVIQQIEFVHNLTVLWWDGRCSPIRIVFQFVYKFYWDVIDFRNTTYISPTLYMYAIDWWMINIRHVEVFDLTHKIKVLVFMHTKFLLQQRENNDFPPCMTTAVYWWSVLIKLWSNWFVSFWMYVRKKMICSVPCQSRVRYNISRARSG